MSRRSGPLAAVLMSAAWMSVAGTALAVEPDEMLPDPALEARAQHISKELRCVVCQNQNIDDSAAPLARDMRLLVRERLTSGDSDAQAKAFLVARYGNFVLLRPPFQPNTWALWLGPFVILGLAGTALVFAARTGAAELPDDGIEDDPLS
jgi:cytochrome c-type biogenesis protein CcmH